MVYDHSFFLLVFVYPFFYLSFIYLFSSLSSCSLLSLVSYWYSSYILPLQTFPILFILPVYIPIIFFSPLNLINSHWTLFPFFFSVSPRIFLYFFLLIVSNSLHSFVFFPPIIITTLIFPSRH